MMKPVVILALMLSSELILAADLSGWSDQTICRLRKEQPNNSAYLTEDQTRNLNCLQAAIKKRRHYQVDNGWCETPTLSASTPRPDYDTSFTFQDHFHLVSNYKLPAYRYTGFGLDPVGHKNGGSVAPEIKAVADFNNDGIDDLWVEFYESEVPPLVLYGSKNGQFKAEQNMPIAAARRHVRNGEAVDINNDGWLDIVGFTTGDPGFRFRAEGYDIGNRNIPRGQADLLLINQQGNGFKHIKIPEIRRNDWNHGGSAGDINGDGLIDILALSEGEREHTVPFINQGNGKFKLNTSPYSPEISRLISSDLDADDINGDGIDDIAVIVRPTNGYSHTDLARARTIRLIYGDNDTNMGNNIQIKFGQSWVTDEDYAEFQRLGKGDTVQAGARASGTTNTRTFVGNTNVEIMDINADGHPDILEGFFLTNTGLWQTSGFTAYINQGNCFSDGTDFHFPSQPTNRRFHEDKDYHTNYIHNFHLADINNDGHKDLMLQVDGTSNWSEKNPTHFPYLFINNGKNIYLPAQTKNVLPIVKNQDDLVPGDFNGDGLTDMVTVSGKWNAIPSVRLYKQKASADEPDEILPPIEFSGLSNNMRQRLSTLLSKQGAAESNIESLFNLTAPAETKSPVAFDGTYKVQWYFLNIGDQQGYEKMATDTLIIKQGIGQWVAGSPTSQPSQKLRRTLMITISPSGKFLLEGILDLFDRTRAYPTSIVGNILNKAGLGIWNDGDPMVIILTKK